MVTSNRRVQFTCLICLSFIDIGDMCLFFLESAILLMVVHCATSSAADGSELSARESEHISHIVQSSTYFT